MERRIIAVLAALLALNIGLFAMLYDQGSRIEKQEEISLKTAKIVISAAHGKADMSEVNELEKAIKIYTGSLPKIEKGEGESEGNVKGEKSKEVGEEEKKAGEESSEVVTGGKTKEGEIEIRKIVFFKLGSFRLPEEELVSIIRLFSETPTTAIKEIVLEGHADSTPRHVGTNYELSLMRAQFVANFLKNEIGIPENLITIIGYGDTKPRFQNQEFNRRVEIVLKKVSEGERKVRGEE